MFIIINPALEGHFSSCRLGLIDNQPCICKDIELRLNNPNYDKVTIIDNSAGEDNE